MKFYYLITICIALFFIDCSSTYKVSDFSSKEKFYDDFNKSAKDKSIDIIISDDSTFTSGSVANILNDSLSFSTRVQTTEKVSRDEIKDIKYSGNDMKNLSATILLKNGIVAKARNVNVLSDSLINATVYKDIYSHIPLDKVKEISCKDHWLGVPLGFLIGTVSGFIVGSSIILLSTNSNTYQGPAQALPIWSSIGLIIGSVWGWLDGHTYTYQFNP